jgi:hypothetical protein
MNENSKLPQEQQINWTKALVFCAKEGDTNIKVDSESFKRQYSMWNIGVSSLRENTLPLHLRSAKQCVIVKSRKYLQGHSY